RQRAALEILAGNVCERLPTGDYIYSISHLGIAGDRANLRVLEPTHEFRDGVGLEMGVGVERHHHLTARLVEPAIESGSFSAVRNADQPDPRIGSKMLSYHLRRGVHRPIIDDDDLEIGIVTCQNVP